MSKQESASASVPVPYLYKGSGVIALLAAACVVGSVFLQYVVGLEPCPLCIVQRLAAFSLMFLAALTWGIGRLGPNRIIVKLVAAILTVGAVVACATGVAAVIYHAWLYLNTLRGIEGSCSLEVSFALMDLASKLPGWFQFMMQGYGSCAPQNVAQFIYIPVLLSAAFGLFFIGGFTLSAAAPWLFRKA